jgi:polysaccharide export outer membrane protein
MLSSLAVAACDGPRGIVQGGHAFAQASQSSAGADPTSQGSAYRLARGDKLKVVVFNEPDLTGEFQVGDTGNVAYPLIGDVPAAGISVQEFQQQLTTRLRGQYVKKPRVSVEVVNYRPFNVFGEVRNSGQYPFRPGLSVQDAVAMAGGFTYRANTRTAYVRRAEAGGEITVAMDGARVPIQPGDDIRVPERYF